MWERPAANSAERFAPLLIAEYFPPLAPQLQEQTIVLAASSRCPDWRSASALRKIRG
jgi:hypothetical protein